MVILPSNLTGGFICICYLSELIVFFPVFVSQVFASGMKVLACWTDCRFYPAKVLSVNRDGEEQILSKLFYFGPIILALSKKAEEINRRKHSFWMFGLIIFF